MLSLKNGWNTGNVSRRERERERETDKQNEISKKYNRGVNIIGVIDNCLSVTAIVLSITWIDLLSTIDAVPAVIGMDAVSIVMGLLRVVGNRVTKMISLK